MFAISLQYLKKDMSDEIDFLHAGNYESLIQIDTMVLMGMAKHSQTSRNRKFAMSLQYLKKQVRDEVDFLYADKHQSFLQFDFNTFGIKVSYEAILSLAIGIIKHSQSTQSNKFAVSFVDKHQSFYKLALSFLMEVARHVQSTQNRK